MLVDTTDLPALTALSRTAPRQQQVRSFLVTHLLETAVQYIGIVHAAYPVEAVIAIPYSSEPSAVEALRRVGIRVLQPPSVMDVSRVAGETLLAALRVSSAPLVVQEVGGYLAGFTGELARFPHFMGIVEDTNNGHWSYECAAPHAIPVLSIAQSPLKDIEDTLIGDAVAFSLERILREEFRTVVQGCRVGILGYGKIGTSTAIAMRGRESAVSVHDIDPIRSIRAKFEGFAIQPLRDILESCDIIIGCSGKTSVTAEDVPWIRDGAVLASASSKSSEFDLSGFGRNCTVSEVNDVVTAYRCPDGKRFHVLSRGTPVNFRDRSILGSVLDLIYSELFVAMRTLIAGARPAGLFLTGTDIHQEVSRAWLSAHGSRAAGKNGRRIL